MRGERVSQTKPFDMDRQDVQRAVDEARDASRAGDAEKIRRAQDTLTLTLIIAAVIFMALCRLIATVVDVLVLQAIDPLDHTSSKRSSARS